MAYQVKIIDGRLTTNVNSLFIALLSFNFMLAGSASTNPVMFILVVLLILAWKIAGFIGAEYFLLNLIGTPWKHHEFVEENLKCVPG